MRTVHILQLGYMIIMVYTYTYKHQGKLRGLSVCSVMGVYLYGVTLVF